MEHTCLKNGQPTGALGPNRPSWAEPGAVTKITDEDRWGRVDLLWKCCGGRQVTLQAEDQDWFETVCLPVDALENPVGAHKVPEGVLLPTPWPRGRS